MSGAAPRAAKVSISGIMLVALLLNAAAFAYLTYSSLWRQSVVGLSPVRAGLLGAAPMSAMAFVVSALSAGQTRALLAAAPPAQRGPLDGIIHTAAASGLNATFIVAGLLGLAGCLIAVATIRRPAMSPAALTQPQPHPAATSQVGH